VAYTPYESDSLEKVVYGDENHDGIEEAFLWIRYATFDGEEIVGSRTYLEVVDGRTGQVLLHGLVTARRSDADDVALSLTIKRMRPGRLDLRIASNPKSKAPDVAFRRNNPEFLAPGIYVLGDNGFHRSMIE
jgi:hypothetical protein